MNKVKVSSKNQIAIPVEISRQLGVEKGQIFLIEIKDGGIFMTPAERQVEKLTGILNVSNKGKKGQITSGQIEEMIRKSKREHFNKKYKK